MKRAQSPASRATGAPLRLRHGAWWPIRGSAVAALAIFVPMQQALGDGAWMSLLGGLVVALLLTYRSWIELDPQRRVANLSWGFLFPLVRHQRRLHGASRVSVKGVQRRTPVGSGGGHRVTIEVFPVTLHYGGDDELVLEAGSNAFAARRLARQVARSFGVALVDELDGLALHVPAEEVAKPLLERLRDAPPSPPSEPAQCRVRVSRSDRGDLLIETPARGFKAWDLPALVLFDCVALLELPVVAGYLESQSPNARAVLLLVGAAIAAFLLVFAIIVLRRWTVRLAISAGAAGLHIVRSDLFFTTTQRIAAQELEELAVRVSRGERNHALVLETGDQQLLLGEGFSAEELTWIRALLLDELLFGAASQQAPDVELEPAG